MITSRKQDRKKAANLTQFFVNTQYVELDLKSSGGNLSFQNNQFCFLFQFHTYKHIQNSEFSHLPKYDHGKDGKVQEMNELPYFLELVFQSLVVA